MNVAVAEFSVMKIYLFSAFFGDFLNAWNRFSVLLVVLNLFQQSLRRFGIFVKVIVKFLAHKIEHKVADSLTVRTHIFAAEFGFCLWFKDRLLNFYADSRRDSGFNVAVIKLFFVKIPDNILLSIKSIFLVSRKHNKNIIIPLNTPKRSIIIVVLFIFIFYLLFRTIWVN